MKRVRRFVSPQELAYYRRHFREAICEDAVVCLECGCLLRDLNAHLRLKHELLTDEYRERWGYNRTTALNIPAVSERHRQRTLEQNLQAKAPKDAIYRAQEANRRYGQAPRRKEFRLDHGARVKARFAAGWRPAHWRDPRRKVEDDALRAMMKEGLAPREIASRTGLSYKRTQMRLRTLGLMAPPRPTTPRLSDSELLAILHQGFWPRQIAARTGRTVAGIHLRMRRLRQRGVDVPAPAGPRPNPNRRVHDEQILPLVHKGLQQKDIASKLGLALSSLEKRLHRLRRRGLLPPTPAISRVPDELIIILARQGLGNWKIARRLGTAPTTVWRRLKTLRRRGLLPPAQRIQATSPPTTPSPPHQA